jgi:hypothetical protein
MYIVFGFVSFSSEHNSSSNEALVYKKNIRINLVESKYNKIENERRMNENFNADDMNVEDPRSSYTNKVRAFKGIHTLFFCILQFLCLFKTHYT